MESLKPVHISGLTVLGGEPFEEENQAVLAGFLERVKQSFPDKTIWCFTGYILEKDLLPSTGRKHTEYTKLMLTCIDIVGDGPFMEDQKDLMLQFRGSRNQRLLKAPFFE